MRSDPRISRVARIVGNNALQQRFAEGRSSRDELLALLVDRLRTIREIQTREVDLCHRGSTFTWWREVADPGKEDLTAPDPTRWHEPARLFQRAGERLCQGDLRRGHELLDQALDAERRAREGLTALVDTSDLGESSAVLPDLPASTSVAGACDPPAELSLAREILSVTTRMPEVPHRKKGRAPWWTREEDEEEEEPGASGDS